MVAEILLIAPQGTEAGEARQAAEFLLRGLTASGHQVREQIGVCENAAQLQKAIPEALERSQILVLLGGMDKASGYMAKAVIAQGLSLPLEINEGLLAAIRKRNEQSGHPLADKDEELAKLPQGAKAFFPTYGTIPGCVVSSSCQHIFLLPAQLAEVIAMFNNDITEYLNQGISASVTHVVHTCGISEAAVCEALGGLLDYVHPTVAVAQQGGETVVRVSASAETAERAEKLCAPILRMVSGRLGEAAYGVDVDSLPAALVQTLMQKELRMALSEAGTDGAFVRTMEETEDGHDVLYHLAIRNNHVVSEQAVVEAAVAARKDGNAHLGVAVAVRGSEDAEKDGSAGIACIAVCDAHTVYTDSLTAGEGGAADDALVTAAVCRAMNMARVFAEHLPEQCPGAVPLGDFLPEEASVDTAAVQTLANDRPIRQKRNPLFVIAFIVALLVFVVSAVYLIRYFTESHSASKDQQELIALYAPEERELPEGYPYTNPSLAALWQENQDVRGYIRIEDTTVDYPVVQTDNNETYLTHNFYGEEDRYGIPFLDYRADVEKPSDNLVIYGHNMTDGQVFGELVNYQELDYYKQHPMIEFNTVYSDHKYKVAAVFLASADEGFDYYNFINARSESQFEEFIEQIKARSLIETGVDLNPEDKLLTLSTCSYELDNMRTVIVAREVREDESEEVDTGYARMNGQPLYPDAWYEKYGGSKPEGIDSSWTVTGTSSSAQSTLELTNLKAQGNELSLTNTVSSNERISAQPMLAQTLMQAMTYSAQTVEQNAMKQAEKTVKAKAAQKAAEEAAAKKAAEEAAQKAAEETAAKKAAEEAAQKAAEEAAAKEAAEEAAQKAAEEAAAKKAAEEAAQKAAEEAEKQEISSGSNSSSSVSAGQLRVKVNGSVVTGDALDIISRIAEIEVGAGFHEEAIKAQAVAAYCYVLEQNQNGTTPSVYMADSSSAKVKNAAASVLGKKVMYGGNVAFTPYHAISAGRTTSSALVWGGSYPYLNGVDSSVDKQATNYRATKVLSAAQVKQKLADIGVDVSGSPSSWFQILSRDDAGYITALRVCGETTTSSGKKLTGRLLRESVLGLRSANFDVSCSGDTFTFTTYGYGHGVGMSQVGANMYAKQGWSYVQILQHYFPGTTVQ